MSGCSAVGCSNRGDRGYFMKSFPRNPERRALWAMQMKRDNWQPNDNCRLCEVHFDDDQWEKTRQDGTRKLKSNAVPTLFQLSEKTTKRKAITKNLTTISNDDNYHSSLQTEYDHQNPRYDLNALKNNSVDSALRVSSQREGEERPVDARCRLCATRNGASYTSIFGKSDLAEKISRCLPIIVLHSDKLPLHVCQQCSMDLNTSYNLIIGSLRADSILRSEYLETCIKLDSTPKDEPVFRINGPIRCDMCDQYFEDMTKFDTHIETEHLLSWRCALCDHSSETREELVAHETLSHSTEIEASSKSDEELETEVPENSEVDRPEIKEAQLSCIKCDIIFDDRKQFRKHHTIHLPKRLKCTICRKKCSSIFEYLNHKRTTHQTVKSNSRNSVHGCKYCKKVFIKKQHLLVHLRKHKKEMLDDPSVTVYKCVTCPKKFVDRALYQKHRNVHDPACWHKYRCYTCEKSFMDQFKLRIHRSIHDGAKPYQCDVCGHAFNRNANMIRHRAKHFEQTCRHCQVVFKNSTSLRVHLKDVHGDTLKPRSTLKGVKKVGGGGRDSDKFICRYCGKQLTSNCSLLDHERIHTGDKPYICEHCGKSFRSITARWDHMVRHEKGNYVCELCGKIMSNRLNLTRHLRRHAAIEERKFECKECGKLFHVAWRLNAHRARIHRSESGDIELDDKTPEVEKN